MPRWTGPRRRGTSRWPRRAGRWKRRSGRSSAFTPAGKNWRRSAVHDWRRLSTLPCRGIQRAGKGAAARGDRRRSWAMQPPYGPARAVLIVEDDWQTRYALRMALEAAGYAVQEAADGADALRQLRRGPRP